MGIAAATIASAIASPTAIALAPATTIATATIAATTSSVSTGFSIRSGILKPVNVLLTRTLHLRTVEELDQLRHEPLIRTVWMVLLQPVIVLDGVTQLRSLP